MICFYLGLAKDKEIANKKSHPLPDGLDIISF